MIWRSLIFFNLLWSNLLGCSLLAAFAVSAASTAGAPGTGIPVSGKVVLRDSRVAAVSKGNYSGVVISLVPADGPEIPPARHARMLQKDKTFIPHILPISTGSTVDFPNLDPIFHSAFSSYSGQIFDIGLYAPGATRSVRFTRPGVVRVFCNIHPTMSAVILVLDTAWFDVTTDDGTFHLNAPPGEYNLNVYHERATEATLRSLTRRITLEAAPVQLPPIVISESGYLAIPHKNKFGHDYPPTSVNDAIYPGARQ